MHDFKLIDEALATLCVTQSEFSQRYFGKSHGYVSAIKATETPPSTSALSHFSQRLRLQLDCMDNSASSPAMTALRCLLTATDEVLMQRAVRACTKTK